jgi:signal transduction histidine kinase
MSLPGLHLPLASAWVVAAVAFALAAAGGVVCIVVLAVIVRRQSRSLRQMDTSGGEAAGRIEAVEQERATRDAILSSLEDGVVLFDPNGSVVYQNEQAARYLGDRVTSVDRLTPTILRETVREAGRTVEVAVGPGQRTLRAAATAAPGGRVLLVLHDVTKTRFIDAVRRDFVANASHELKTPAASIRALAETMRDAAADDVQAVRHFAEQLEREAVRLSRIISDLLDLSRLEGGMEEQGDVRLDRLVVEEAERHRGAAEAANLTFAVTDDVPVSVQGSPKDLALLVRNLVQNAIQYTRAGGVEVRVGAEDGQAVITVLDTGVGIPSRDRARIFERFYRVNRARSRESGGTGLGLSIVKHVAENHRGTVEVQSELGEGSAFTVRIPFQPGR